MLSLSRRLSLWLLLLPLQCVAATVTIDWVAPTLYTNGAPLSASEITRFDLYQRCDAGTQQHITPAGIAANLRSLSISVPNTVVQCWYAMTVSTAVGTSSKTNEASWSPPGLAPGAPTNLTVTWAESPPSMAAAHEDKASDANTASSTITVTPAAPPASGEWIFISYNYVSNSSGNYPSSYTPPSGFSQVAQVQNGFGQLTMWKKKAGGSEPSSYAVSITGGDFYSGAVALDVWSGLDGTNPHGTPVTGFDASASTSFSIPALTTTVNNSVDYAVVSKEGSGGSGGSEDTQFLSSWGSSLNELNDTHFDYAGIGTASAVRASAGLQAATTVTSAHSDNNLAIRLELLEATGGGGSAIAAIAQSYRRRRAN